jgi:hypothetical protein
MSHGAVYETTPNNFNLNSSSGSGSERPTTSHSPLSTLSPRLSRHQHRTAAAAAAATSNRTRAASHDIILNINDVLPSYNNELAERIDSITEDDVRSFQSGGLFVVSPMRSRAHTSPRMQLGELSGDNSSSEDDTVSIRPQAHDLQDRDEMIRNRANTCPEAEEDESTSVPLPVAASPARRSHSAIVTTTSPPPTTTSPTPTPRAIPTTTTTTTARPTNHCIFRHQNLLRTLMLLSLYLTLSYTWHYDLQFRYKSVEINDGLNDYWTGGGLLSLNTEEGGVKERLLLGDSNALAVESTSALSTSEGVESEKKKRRPNLSHARSLDSITMGKKNARRNFVESKNTWSKLAWGMVCIGFMIPIVEAGWGEVRRYWRLRRRVVSGSVHDL